MLKKALLLLLLSTSTVYSQTVDYSKGNPFQKKYEYSQIQNKKKDNTPSIENINSSRSVKTTNLNGNLKAKYKHLIDNNHLIQGCWDQAGRKHNVDPWLLFSIAKTESSFNPRAVNINKNKSKDIGIMQINTFWFPILEKKGIKQEHLYNPCLSIHVGAWIVAQNIKRFGYNIDGIGAYLSPNNKKLRREYGAKIVRTYNEVLTDFNVIAHNGIK